MVFTIINNEDDYKQALSRIEELIDAKPGSIEYKELNELALLIDDYEDLLCNGGDDNEEDEE